VLLVIAHPDDETMFFTPLLETIIRNKAKISILCLSTGNFEGLGSVRKKELIKSASLYGIGYEDVHIIDSPDMQDGMMNNWPVETISNTVIEFIQRVNPCVVVTFDENGASFHPNHIATYHGVKKAMSLVRLEKPKIIGLKLLTKNIIQKFLGPLELIISLLSILVSENIVVINFNVLKPLKGMYAHKSQNALYRQIFILISAMTYANNFAEIL